MPKALSRWALRCTSKFKIDIFNQFRRKNTLALGSSCRRQKFNLFPSLTVALQIITIISATVASAERFFSALKRVENVLLATVRQDKTLEC